MRAKYKKKNNEIVGWLIERNRQNTILHDEIKNKWEIDFLHSTLTRTQVDCVQCCTYIASNQILIVFFCCCCCCLLLLFDLYVHTILFVRYFYSLLQQFFFQHCLYIFGCVERITKRTERITRQHRAISQQQYRRNGKQIFQFFVFTRFYGFVLYIIICASVLFFPICRFLHH